MITPQYQSVIICVLASDNKFDKEVVHLKKHTALFMSGALTLAIGAAVIVGNIWAASQVFASAINEETPAKIISTGYEAQQMSATKINDTAYTAQQPNTADITPPQSDVSNGGIEIVRNYGEGKMKTVMKTLENGEIILLEYLLDDESQTSVSVIHPSGEIRNLDGDDAMAVITGFDGIVRIPKNVKGDPSDSGITEKDAVSTAVNAIVDKYALKQEIVSRYTITAAYYTVYEDIDGAVWWVLLYPTNVDDFVEIGCYTALINGETGEVVKLLSAADGKG